MGGGSSAPRHGIANGMSSSPKGRDKDSQSAYGDYLILIFLSQIRSLFKFIFLGALSDYLSDLKTSGLNDVEVS
jgi:hypothetical protein